MLLPLTSLDATRESGEQMLEPPAKSGLSPEQRKALERLAFNREKIADPADRALVEELAKKEGISLRPAKGFTQTSEDIRLDPSTLPMLGQVGGQVAGAIMRQPPSSRMALEGIGGTLGTKANELIGVSKPTDIDYILSAAAPVVGNAIGARSRSLIPGAAAAEQQIAAGRMRNLPGMMEGSSAETKAAYDAVKGGDLRLQVPNFNRTVQELATSEATAKKYGVSSPKIGVAVRKTAEELAQSQGGAGAIPGVIPDIPFNDSALLLKRYREKIAGLENKGGEDWGAYKALRKSLFNDLDEAVAQASKPEVFYQVHFPKTNQRFSFATKEEAENLVKMNGAQSGQVQEIIQARGPGVGEAGQRLKLAMAQAKKQIAKDELSEILEKHGVRFETVGTATFETIDPTKVLNKLKDIGWKDAVGGAQYSKVEGMLKQLAAVPKPTSAVQTGIGSSGRLLASGGVGAAAGLTGAMLGAGAVESTAGAVGTAAAAYGAVAAWDAAASLMMNDRGRNVLVKIFKHNRGQLGPKVAQVLQFAATQFQDDTE